jgi:hypothetical protein
MGALAALLPGLKGREMMTEFTFMAASGCRREMGGANTAESMDAKLVEDPTEECEAGDGRESRGACRTAQGGSCSDFFFWRCYLPAFCRALLHTVKKERVGYTTNEKQQIPSVPFLQ